MVKEIFDPKLPTGFNYSIKNEEMILNFFCDCCHEEIKVSKKLQKKIESLEKSFQEVFDDLKKEMDGRFYRCDQCKFLICSDCWENRNTKCKNCTIVCEHS